MPGSQRVSAFRGASKMPAMANEIINEGFQVRWQSSAGWDGGVFGSKFCPAVCGACADNIPLFGRVIPPNFDFDYPFCSRVWLDSLLLAKRSFSFNMASQNPADATAPGAAEPQTLPDRTNPADTPQGESKNAAKKAAKLAKLAADKADKANKPKQPKQPKDNKQEPKKAAPKKKDSGKELIGIDVEKETDFPEWYHQVLTKGQLSLFQFVLAHMLTV